MSLHILDTDTLTLLQWRHAKVLARVAACKPDELAITVLSVEEQLSGWYRRLRTAKKEDELAKVYDRLTTTICSLARLPVLTFNENAIRRAKALHAAKLGVRKMDLSIAAVALEHHALVVTRNVRDFQRVPGLVVEDWSV